MQADRRLYVTLDGRLVPEHDPAAAFLLAGKGHEIPPDVVARLGLEDVDGRVQQGGPAAAEPATAEVEVEVPAEPEADAPAPVMPPETRRYRRRSK